MFIVTCNTFQYLFINDTLFYTYLIQFNTIFSALFLFFAILVFIQLHVYIILCYHNLVNFGLRFVEMCLNDIVLS